MSKSVLLLGSNLQHRESIIAKAIAIIGQLNECKILNKSNLYESEAWGFESENQFLNQAIEIETSLHPTTLLKALLNIENQLGRVRKHAGYESRIIDIDILFYDHLVINLTELNIPHPRLHLRRFTLICLVEIIPNFIHPTLQKSIQQLHDECIDYSKVWTYEPH
jgi:2-amino-4-hydroxy-6-hydroxymethyldihydropteridine diphosphokinase